MCSEVQSAASRHAAAADSKTGVMDEGEKAYEPELMIALVSRSALATFATLITTVMTAAQDKALICNIHADMMKPSKLAWHAV